MGFESHDQNQLVGAQGMAATATTELLVRLGMA